MPPEVEVLFLQDEILQAMYWMKGEGLAEAVTPGDLCILLDSEEQKVAGQMEHLVAKGLLQPRDGRLALTTSGRGEGGRRFLDEFRDLLRQGHGECGPECWCHQAQSLAETCWGEELSGGR